MTLQRTFSDVLDDGLLFSGISAVENSVGTVDSVLADASLVASAAANSPVATVAGLRWTGFVGAAIGAGSSLPLVIDYDVTSTNPNKLISALRQNSFVPDSMVPVGASLKLTQEFFTDQGILVGMSVITRTPTMNDPSDPPFESGDIPLTGAYGTIHVRVTVELVVNATAAVGAKASFSVMNQAYNTSDAASLGDFVFEDRNRDGVQDAGDVAIAGVTVLLLDAAGNPIGLSTVTDATGFYGFSGLVPGSYAVRFVTPAGYVPTLANVGSDALDSDAVGGATQPVTLSSGEFNGTLDAGFVRFTPGIDIEKTTNGPSNTNPVAPTYDNEDTAAGSGVPILTAGSSVAWTYKVANTGNTTFTASEVSIVDDNGTSGNAADDMTLANGKISFASVAVGDADNLLEAGEVWLYKATGIVQDLTIAGATSTFDFSGGSALDGTDGNVRAFTAGGASVKTSAFSRDGATGNWATGWLGSYGVGLGVTDSGESSGGSNSHMVDNVGRDNYVLFSFDQKVVVDKAYLGYVVGDSDLSVWIGSVADPYNTKLTLSDAVLTSLGFTEVNDTTLATARWADFNAGKLAGNVLVIAASTADTTPDDWFKIEQLTVQQLGHSGIYENNATATAQGATDFDLSHYKNADIWSQHYSYGFRFDLLF